MYATDRRPTDRQTSDAHHRLMLRVGGIITTGLLLNSAENQTVAVELRWQKFPVTLLTPIAVDLIISNRRAAASTRILNRRVCDLDTVDLCAPKMGVLRARWGRIFPTEFEYFCDFPFWIYCPKRGGQTDGKPHCIIRPLRGGSAV